MDLPRTIWNGVLVLRELAIPVGLAPTRVDGDPKFGRAHNCGLRLEQTGRCPEHGDVAGDEITRVFEAGPGQLLPVDQEQLDQLAPVDDRIIDLTAIVDDNLLEQLLVKRSYWLVPGKTAAGRRAYATLTEALALEELAALGRFTAWNAEQLAAVRAYSQVLLLHNLAPAEDLRDGDPIRDLIAGTAKDSRDVDLMRKLLTRLEIPYGPDLIASRHRARLVALLDGELAAGNLTPQLGQPAPIPTGDLGKAIEESLKGLPRSHRQRREHALAS